MSDSKPSVLQPWVSSISMMQQTVLLTALRGPDGIRKDHPIKPVLRWYRRCVLYSAFERKIMEDPWSGGGGSFTGPLDSSVGLGELQNNYLRVVDEMPLHFHTHFMHAIEILGYKHPKETIRNYWASFYIELCKGLHLRPELESEMDLRLGDNFQEWKVRDAVHGQGVMEA